MLLAALCLSVVVRGPALEGQARARWSCSPSAVAVGEPFELVLELEHDPALAGSELAGGELVLDESWVVLAEEPARGTVADGAATDGATITRRVWRVASLEPGERSLADALSAFALSERVSRIGVGEARVAVSGVLAEDEDAPRPLREFPDGFADVPGREARSSAVTWIVAGALLAALGAGAVLWQRRRARRARRVPAATPLERLGELEGWIEHQRGREGCYELTRLLRESTDRARAKDRAGLTDDEWLAELGSSLEIPRNAVTELEQVFQSAARVKYAGDAPTAWALKETFARARSALQIVGSGGSAR